MRDLVIKTREAAPGSPLAGNSPRADVGEIDMRAPFHSVKDAVSLFGDAGSPKSATATVAKKKADERLLEVEAQHHLMVKARLHLTHQLRTTEAAKAQALRELQMAEKTLEQLRNKLHTLTDSKQASIAATEAAKVRALELEEERVRRAQLGDETWKYVLNNERELYRTTTAELMACQEELANLRQDHDAMVVKRLAMFQKAEEAQDELQKNEARRRELMTEVDQLRQSFDEVKRASLEAEEEYMKLVVEKEELLHSHKLNKERVEKEIKRLEEEYVPTETLQAKLDETMEAIRVLQEQLHDIQSTDLYAIRQMASELDSAKRALEEAVAEENSLRTSIDSTKKQLEEVKSELPVAEKAASDAESATEQMQGDLEKSEAELEKVKSGCGFIMQSCIEKLLEESEMARHEAEISNKTAELLREEVKAAAAVTQETDEKLKMALKEAEEAKAVERLAEERIYYYQGHDDAESHGTGSTRRIRLSVEEFDSMNKKIKECTNKADIEVAKLEIKEAVKTAEMAEAARRLVETELQKWRQNEHSEAAKAK